MYDWQVKPEDLHADILLALLRTERAKGFGPNGFRLSRIRSELSDHGFDEVEKETVLTALDQLSKSGLVRRLRTQPPQWALASESGDRWETAEDKRYRKAKKRARKIAALGPVVPPAKWDERLFDWQREALAAWYGRGCVGVVEAVTGTGKTIVGVQAAKDQLEQGGKVLILVPTIPLVNQWHQTLQREIGSPVGRRGGRWRDDLRSHDIVVSTVQSALVDLGLGWRDGLLIADECHHYGAATWSKALKREFRRRLGLSATYRRGDEGDRMLLAPYFGKKPIFELGYRRAIDDGIVAPFRLAFVGVELDPDARALYADLEGRVGRLFATLVNVHNFSHEPYAKFMQMVAAAAEGPNAPARKPARAYLKAQNDRRELLAENPAKHRALRQLAPMLSREAGTIIFTQTKESAKSSAELLGAGGFEAAAIYADLNDEEREAVLLAFREGQTAVISAPKLLDEGIDVPDADVGVVLAASPRKRQMIQRMGRVLRRGTQKDFARLVVLYATNTSEDPARGVHDGFIEAAWDVAQAKAIFHGPNAAAEAVTFFGGPRSAVSFPPEEADPSSEVVSSQVEQATDGGHDEVQIVTPTALEQSIGRRAYAQVSRRPGISTRDVWLAIRDATRDDVERTLNLFADFIEHPTGAGRWYLGRDLPES